MINGQLLERILTIAMIVKILAEIIRLIAILRGQIFDKELKKPYNLASEIEHSPLAEQTKST